MWFLHPKHHKKLTFRKYGSCWRVSKASTRNKLSRVRRHQCWKNASIHVMRAWKQVFMISNWRGICTIHVYLTGRYVYWKCMWHSPITLSKIKICTYPKRLDWRINWITLSRIWRHEGITTCVYMQTCGELDDIVELIAQSKKCVHSSIDHCVGSIGAHLDKSYVEC